VTARQIYTPQEEQQNLHSVIVGDHQFVGYFLGELLKKQGSDILNKDSTLSNSVDYIFCLSNGQEKEIEEAITLSKLTKAKLLISLPLEKQQLRLLLQNKLSSENIDFRLVLLARVYGPRMNHLEYQKIKSGDYLLGDLVFVTDAIYALERAMFGSGSIGKTFTFVSADQRRFLPGESLITPITFRSRSTFEDGITKTDQYFQNIKTKINPPQKIYPDLGPNKNLEIKYLSNVPHSTSLNPVSLNTKSNLLKFNNHNSQGIVSILHSGITPQKPLSQPQHASRSQSRKTTSNLILGILILTPFLLFLILGIGVFWGLRNSQKYLLEGKFGQASKAAIASQESLNLLNPVIEGFSSSLSLIGFTQTSSQIDRYLAIARISTSAIVDASTCGNSSLQLLNYTFKNSSNVSDNPRNLILKLNSCSDRVYWQLSYLQILSKNTKLEKTFSFLPQLRQQLLDGHKILSTLPDLLGLDQPKTYLILFQNNSELRPTGGFIGSYGLLSFDRGVMNDFEVKDVYWADGQLQGHVEPPAELKKSLGEAGWYLRDSNWDPDFPVSAARAAWFLNKETGRTVDGVVGTNMFFVQKLLGVVGELNVTDFNEKINAQNLFERAEYHSEANFFPGSTGKQDFLGAVSRALISEIQAAQPGTTLALTHAIWDTVQQKDLFLYSGNHQTESTFLDLGWGGEVRSIVCPSSGVDPYAAKCIADSLFLVEANVGVNKANYFLKRQIDHKVTIDENNIFQEKTTVSYQNTSQSNVFPSGQYKSYLRFYLSKQAIYDSAVIKDSNGNLIKTLTSKDIDLSSDLTNQIVGLVLEVPVASQRVIELSYHLANKADSPSIHYLFLMQKQSGIIDDQYHLNLNPGSDFSLTSANPNGNFTQNGYLFDGKLNQDLLFDLNLSKK
jgi:hypothetical protein